LVASCLLVALVGFWTFAPVGFRPQYGYPFAERFLAFFALGGALAVSAGRGWLAVAAVICLVAISTEALQIVISTRDARLIDAAEKCLGGLAGVTGIAWTVRRLTAFGRR
jgi:VanZ family protein